MANSCPKCLYFPHHCRCAEFKLQAENRLLKKEIKKAIKFIDETPRRDTVIDAIKYNLDQALRETNKPTDR